MRRKNLNILVVGLNFFIAIIFSLNVFAKNSAKDCNQILVVGDINWPPYSIQKESYNYDEFIKDDDKEYNISEILNEKEKEKHDSENPEVIISGVGIELVQKIFAELDIPVQVVKLDNKRNIFNALHLGDIDILVSTYNNRNAEEVVNIISPGYFLDPIAVYVRKGTAARIKRWDDLIGKRGVRSDYFAFNSDFEDYMNKYLYIHSKGNLNAVLEMVSKGKADYVIGSKMQLEYGVKEAHLEDELEMLTAVTKPDYVHMGYSKRSLCKTYLPYLRKRLLELKEDGTIDTIVDKYIKQEENKPSK